jgi:hypothetical protein
MADSELSKKKSYREESDNQYDSPFSEQPFAFQYKSSSEIFHLKYLDSTAKDPKIPFCSPGKT